LTERFFSRDYVEHAELRDGTRVLLRLVTPDDKDLLRAGFERLSSESRYARFLVPKERLSDDELRYLCEIDYDHHFALGAIREGSDPPVGLGIARFIRLDDPEIAEAAIAVADEVHGQGLGKLLFLRLVAAASERGVARFRLEVLGSNTSMAALVAAVSPERTIEVGGGVMSIEIELPEVTPTQPSTDPAPHGPMYRLFRLAAENALDWTAAVRRFWLG
jgi:GNAT superfamily N-acetyltransferase